MVEEARRLQSGRGRDYYGAFRNTLAETHWRSDDISTFEDALDGLVATQNGIARQEHYQDLGEKYIRFWKKHDGAHYFRVPTVTKSINGLTVRVFTEIGMRYRGDELALKLYLRAPQRPTREFRQTVQEVTTQARQGTWDPNWQSVLLDLHREDILYPPNIPPSYGLVLEGPAESFQHWWKRLDEIAESKASRR